jgi:hypothetical protein
MGDPARAPTIATGLGRKVDYRTTSLHVRHHVLRTQKRAGHVQSHYAFEERFIHFCERLACYESACDVDKDVNAPAERLARFADEILDVGRAGHVGAYRNRGATCRFDGSDRCLTIFRLVVVVDDDFSAAGGERFGYGPADIARASGNYGDFPFKTAHYILLRELHQAERGLSG